MCLAVLTTAHPAYALIVLSNRDEFLLRPTTRPHWYDDDGLDDGAVLSARDLQRPQRGTWIGITRRGKLAILTNFRDEPAGHEGDAAVAASGLLRGSRGAVTAAWLRSAEGISARAFADDVLRSEGIRDVGGFSLVCGTVRPSQRMEDPGGPCSLVVVSNRQDTVAAIADRRDGYYGLSNAAYEPATPWPKVQRGEKLLQRLIEQSVAEDWSRDVLVAKCFELLSTDTMPPRAGRGFAEYSADLRNSIYIPLIMADVPATEGVASKSSCETAVINAVPYATQRQTLIMVDWAGHVTFIERACYDEAGMPLTAQEGEVAFEFDIEE